MAKELKRTKDIKSNTLGRDYILKWFSLDTEGVFLMKIHEKDTDVFVLSIQVRTPHEDSFIENDAYFEERERQMEAVFNGQPLSLEDIIIAS